MKARPAEESDLARLRAMAGQSAFPYPDLDGARLEALIVVVDADGRPVMAAAAESILQMYLFADGGSPAARLHALRLLHDEMAGELRRKGWSEANAFLPPGIAKTFGRRLARSFGWVPNWPSWFLRF